MCTTSKEDEPEVVEEGLPAGLLAAISAPGGSRVVLVLGAGCSVEGPTGLPLAHDLAKRCHQSLVSNLVLRDGEVNEPENLSALAEAVVAKTGGQQALVDLFRPDSFRNAEPNEGYCIAAAFLLEGAVSTVLTLNFDLAANAALTQLSAQDSVQTIRGPGDHHRIGARNLIYLHRDINFPADDLILSSAALDEEWKGKWEEVIAQRVIGAPATVFVGLGSPIGVLAETTQRVVKSLEEFGAALYVVDPDNPTSSDFVDGLGTAESVPIKLGWGDFMRKLSARVVEKHRAEIEDACQALIATNISQEEEVSDLCARLAKLGIVALGRLRANWLLEKRSYCTHETPRLMIFSDLLLAVGMIERVSGARASFAEDGLVEFLGSDRTVIGLICSGEGWRNRTRMKAEVDLRRERPGTRKPSFALVAHFEDSGSGGATPEHLIDPPPEDDVSGGPRFRLISLTELRAAPDLILEMVS